MKPGFEQRSGDCEGKHVHKLLLNKYLMGIIGGD